MTAATELPAALSPSSSATQPSSGWRQNIPPPSFWMFFVSSTIFALTASAYFFLHSVYLVELNFTEAAIGRITAALTLGSMLGTIPMGMLARKVGIRATVMCCIPVSAAAFALRICLTNYAAQIALGFVAGLTLCAWAVCLAPAVASLCSEKTRTFAFSAIFASGIAITGVGMLLASQAPHILQRFMPRVQLATTHLHQIAAVIACMAAALSITPLGLLPLGRLDAPRQNPRSMYPFLRRFLPAVALWTFASAAFAPFVTIFFTRHQGISVQQLGLFLSSSQIAQATGVVLAPLVLRRFGFGPTMMSAQFAAACALLLLAAAKTVLVVEVLYWMYIGLTSLSEPCLYSILMACVAPDQRAGASSAHQLVSGFTVTLAAIVTGAIISRFGYQAVFLLLSVCTIGSAVVFFRLGRSHSDTQVPG